VVQTFSDDRRLGHIYRRLALVAFDVIFGLSSCAADAKVTRMLGYFSALTCLAAGATILSMITKNRGTEKCVLIGKTTECVRRRKFRDGWHITHSLTHCCA